jgi:hypothetical protein
MSDQQQPERLPSVEGSQASSAVTRQRELGAAALTVVLWLLLIDVAVETFMNGAPVRWWVAGVVAAFLSLAAVVSWRGSNRFGWSRSATASFFVLLGLLAWTVWLPDGLTNGVAMLRQPTTIILSAVSALAVAAAGLMLVRVRFLPWWGRAAFGLLALYGVAAFVLGIMDGIPYGALFDGGSLWRRLPYWLQGTFVGTLVAVPLALIAALVEGIGRLRAANGPGWGFQQSVVLSLATVMAVPGVMGTGGGGETTNPGGRTLEKRPVPSARSRQELLREFKTAIDRTAASIDPADIDIGARARQLGNADAIFKWVAETIRYEHYDGVLRGALGTMVSGAGNSCDKALLLSELLSASNHISKVRVSVADSALNARLVKLALESTTGIPADDMTGADGYLLSRASSEVRSISGAMPDFAAALQQPSPVPVVASFCWVAADRGGTVIVLDPSLQTQTAPAPEDAGDALARQRFTVQFSVVLETSNAGVRKEELVHSSSFSADAVGYRPITLTITPSGHLLAALKTSADPWAAMARIDTFYPVISFGDRDEITQGFSLSGKLVPLNTTPLQGVDSMANRVGDMLRSGRAERAPRRTGAAQDSEVSAAFDGIRLDIDVTGPGVRERTSRALVRGNMLRAQTRTGAAALRVIQQRQFLVPAFALSRAYGAHLLVEHFRRNGPLLEALASAPATSELPEVDQYPLQLLALATRQDHGASLIGSRHSGALFRARPAVLAEASTFEVEGAALTRRMTIDIMETGFAALSGSGSSRLLRALLGAQSTVIESEVMADQGGSGTIAVLQRAAARKISLIAIGDEKDPALAQVSIPISERAGLMHDLQAGYAVLTVPQLVSATFPRYAWWRVDRNTGEVLGVLPSREGGQTATEKVMMDATAGAVTGGAFTYLNCYFFQKQGGYRCLFSAACGALIGGLAGGAGGLVAARFGGATLRWVVAEAAAAGGVGFFGEFCEVPPHDPNDNDGDGIPNNRDDNDDNPRNDDSDLPDEPRWPGGPSDQDDDNDDYPDNEDAFPSDRTEHLDHDHDGIGDNSDSDADADGVPTCGGLGFGPCDAYPTDEAAYSDIDGDYHDDRTDPFVDRDGDGIDDEQDACVPCRLAPQNDFDRDGQGNIHDPAPRDPKIHDPGKWNRNARYPDGPRMPKRPGS